MSPALRWTSEKPSVPGWYWYRGETDLNEIIVWVSTDLRVVFAGTNFRSWPVEEIAGEWSGPLTPPDDQAKEAGAC